MNDKLKEKLIENGLYDYINIFEQHKLDTEELLSDLTQFDFDKMGINLIGDQKKILSLFKKEEIFEPIINTPAIYKFEEKYEDKRDKENPSHIIINVPNGDRGNAVHTGIAGIIGGILGAVAVIVIILVILSNETFSL